LAISVRLGTPADVQDVANLALELYRLHQDMHPIFQPSDTFHERYATSILEDMQSATYSLVVATVEERLVGFADGYIWEFPYLRQSRRGFLSSVFILPAYRKQGIAARLVDQMHQWYQANSVQYVELNVAAQNTQAYRYWVQSGYEPVVQRMVAHVGRSQ